jgi:hypothetical protein
MSALSYRRMLAQIPLDNAAQRIRTAVATSRVARRGFVQLRVDADRGTLTVYWHGRLPAPVQRLFAALRQHLHLVVRPARYTATQLDRAVRQVLRGHHPALTSVGPLTDGDGISVGMSGRVPALSPRSAQRLLNDSMPVTLHAQAPMRALTCQANQADTLPPASRCDDLPPNFYGGAVVSIFAGSFINGYCTTGFGVHFSNSSTGMLTAGHCINNSVFAPGPTWWNGQATTELGSVAHTPYRDSATVASHDDGVIVTPAISGANYYDGPSIFSGDTHNIKHVVGAQSVNPGDWTCESGSFGGVLCAVHVLAINQTISADGALTSGVAIASGANANQPTEGDSGGPVFSLAGTGTVWAKGVLDAAGGSQLAFTPWQVISGDLGVSINT